MFKKKIRLVCTQSPWYTCTMTTETFKFKETKNGILTTRNKDGAQKLLPWHLITEVIYKKGWNLKRGSNGK